MLKWVLIVCFLENSFGIPAVYRLTRIHNQHFILDVECAPPRGDVCVEIRRCPKFANLLDASPIPRPRRVIQEIRSHQCGFYGNSPKVCCTLPKQKPTLPPEYFEKSVNLAKGLYNHKNIDLLPKNCGAVSNNYRILSGSETGPFEFPWMALLAFHTKDGIEFKCGGSIINTRYVLTAAHCVTDMTLAGVRLGEHNINTEQDCDFTMGVCSTVQDFYIENVIIHPKYTKRTFENDIALIRLATTANFTYENVKPICLPLENPGETLHGKFAVVSGWGVTENGYKSPILLKVSVPVIPTSECKKIHSSYSKMTESQICAGGYLGRDSCGGDSGGPLKYINLIEDSPKYVQYGIVSYGPKQCGMQGKPGVYTDVSKFTEWILDNLKPAD